MRCLDHGFSLTEMLVVLIIGSLLSVMLIEFYRQIKTQIDWQNAQWQALQRWQIASAIIQQDVEQAGFWGIDVINEKLPLHTALQGGLGKVRCDGNCWQAGQDHFQFGRSQQSALIVRYAMTANQTGQWQLPVWANYPEKISYYASAYYLDGSPKGLYQRLVGYRQAVELIRGIDALSCQYALLVQNHINWVTFNALLDWQQIIGVQCELTAVSEPVFYRGQLTRAQVQQPFRALAYNIWNRIVRHHLLMSEFANVASK